MKDNLAINFNKLEIRVDMRTELVGILEVISDYKKYFPHLLKKMGNTEYINIIEDKFMKFKDHETVNLFNYLIKNTNFSYDAPLNLFLQLEKDFSYNKLEDYPFKTRLNSDPKVLELLNSLPKFIYDTNFYEFYNNNTKRYTKYLNNFIHNFNDLDLIDSMEEYFGIYSNSKFVINLIPWQSAGNYGINTSKEVVANICPYFKNKDDNELFYNDINTTSNLYLAHHEFSHNYINPITEKYSLIDEKSDLFEEIKEKMYSKAYTTNSSIINEHIIRSLTARWFYLKDFSEKKYKNRINNELGNGFIFIEPILEALVYYEKNRETYKNIDEFYPVIIDYIKKDKTKRISHVR